MKKNRSYGFFYLKKKPKLKLLMVMKFTIIFLILSMVNVFGSGYSQTMEQRLSFEVRQASLREIFSKIEENTTFKFLYTDEIVKHDERIDYQATNQSVQEVLGSLLKKNNLEYRLLEDNLIVIKPQDDKSEQFVSGRVTDSDSGEGLPGVNVLVKGTSIGTVTDLNGNYSISIPNEDAILVFSFVGYLTEEVAASGQSEIQISLAPDIMKMDEVVVVGYGVQRKKVVTGSITSVSSEEIEKVPVVGLDQILQGRAPGVWVSQNSNAPGGAVSVRIRGVHSTSGGNEPLYVIDGVPVQNENLRNQTQNGGEITSPLNAINPSDIESIEILKDGAAAIYGTRAAAGVVLITTKRGTQGKGTISFDSYYGMQTVDKTIPLTNASQYVELYNKMLLNSGMRIDPDYEDHTQFTESTDWQKAILVDAPIQNYNLSVSGGGENNTYYISSNYYKQDGIIEGSSYDRFSVRVNTDNNVTRRLKFGNSLTLSRSNDDFVHTNDVYHGVVTSTIRFSPLIPVYDTLGNYSEPTGTYSVLAENPKAYAMEVQQDLTTYQALGNLYGEYSILPSLTYRLSTGIDFVYANQELIYPREMQGLLDQVSNLGKYRREQYEYLVENTLSFKKSFGDHLINVMAGTSVQEFRGDQINVSAEILDNENPYYIRNFLVDTTRKGDGWINEEVGFLSFYGRLMYTYQDKYLFSASLRRDGSTRFGPNNKYGNFPYVSVGWNIAEEDFMSNVRNIVSDAKLRMSWARVGSAEIGNFEYLSRIDGTGSYPFNNAYNQALYSKKAPNPSLQWEGSETTNFGLDLSLFNNKVLFTTEYFIKNTVDMLINVPLPNMLGVEEDPRLNAGKVQNKGFEFDLSYRKYEGDIKFDVRANLATISNEVIDLGGPEKSIYATFTRTMEGYPIGAFYGYVTDGIFNSYDEIRGSAVTTGRYPFDEETGELLDEKKLYTKTAPGDIRFVDIDGPEGVPDGIIDSYDRKIIGNPFPDLYYGFSGNIRFKGIDLGVVFEGVQGNDVVNATLMSSETMTGLNNFTLNVYENHWTPENTDTDVPRPVVTDPNKNREFSDRFIEDGSYLRMKSIQLGYTLPSRFTRYIGIDRLRVYVTGKNLLTITDYSGYDPDIGSYKRNVLETGIDRGAYPLAKSYMVGVNVKF